MRLALNLQQARRDSGLTQEELADRSDVHQTYISDVERGRRNPSLLVLHRLAAALKLDVSDLLKPRR
jgi:transcriptional regulator with XRE-family HTH domain